MGGCASSPEHFAKHRQSLSDLDVCRTLRSANQGSDQAFIADVSTEASDRGLDADRCTSLITRANQTMAAALLVIGAAAAVAAARSGGGGYGSPAQQDYDWAWDQFYTQGYQLVWACRGVQTGEFADQYRCAGKSQSDHRWPGK
ncbi:MAG: hypothetical protein EOP38_21150 [Rubrivivax sp.]|nr:MAG: hypothetical protein EOP38_21150 [Rubrivivax sp.]